MKSGNDRERNGCTRLALQCSLLVVLLSQVATATAGSLHVGTNAFVSPPHESVNDSQLLDNAMAGDSLSASTGGLIGGFGFAGAQGLASASFGLLGAQAGGASFQPLFGNFISGGGQGSASWTDMVTLIPINPALLSLPGSFMYSVSVGGNLAMNLSGIPFKLLGSASFSASIEVEGSRTGASGFLDLALGSTVPTVSGDPPNVLLTGTGPFIWGTPFSMSVSLSAGASAARDLDSTGNIEASAQMLGTLRWLGIASVLDAGNNAINDYSVLSESGTDWRVAAVPAPAGAILFLSGLFVIGMRRLLVRSR